MRSVLGVLLCGLVGIAAVSILGVGQGDVSSYDISVHLDPDTNRLIGVERVEYANDTGGALDEVLFCLIANWGAEPNPYVAPSLLDSGYVAGFDSTRTEILSVSDGDGNRLGYRLEPAPASMQTYSLDDGLLVVELPASLAPGERFTLTISFETKFAAALAADMCVYRDTYVWRFGWNPIAVSRAARDGRFALPSGLYRVEFSVPSEYEVFGGADEQAVAATSEAETTWSLWSDRPVRSVPLLVGRDLEAVHGEWNGVPIDVVYSPGSEGFARLALTYAIEVLADHSTHYGPFAGRRLVIGEDPTPGYYGLGADGMVLVGSLISRMKDMPALGMYDRLIDYLLAHEIAHLWWGIGIGTDFDAENWISEGFAEYLSIRYFEDKYGAFGPNLFVQLGEGLAEDVVADVLGYYNLRQHQSELPYLSLLKAGFDEAIVKPLRDVEYLNGETIRTYSKGYLVLRALEGVVGRDAMDALLREAAATWIGRTLTVAELQSFVERSAGNALYSGFFDDWVYGTAQIDVAIDGFSCTNGGTAYVTTADLRRSGPPLPVSVAATLSDGSTVRATWTSGDGAAVAVPLFETSLPVVHIQLDPEEVLPDRNRFNNHWPRKIVIEGPFRDPEAPPIGRPLDAYVITWSGLGVSGSFRNDHQWSLVALPHMDEETDFSNLDWVDFFSRWDAAGAFAADLSREVSVQAQVTLDDFDVRVGTGELDAVAVFETRFFTHPETGSAGRYWMPTYQLDVGLGALGSVTSPIPYMYAAVGYTGYPARDRDAEARVTLGTPGLGTQAFALFEGWSESRFRLGPLWYLDVSGSLSETLLDPVPTEFQFSLGALHAFSELPKGKRQVYLGFDLVLPPVARDLGYAVFNLTRVDALTPSIFLRGGRTWLEAPPVFDLGFRVEAGAEISMSLLGPLGLTFELVCGYAVPLAGWDATESVYLEFHVSL